MRERHKPKVPVVAKAKLMAIKATAVMAIFKTVLINEDADFSEGVKDRVVVPGGGRVNFCEGLVMV